MVGAGTVAHAVTTAHRALAQQRARAAEIGLEVLAMHQIGEQAAFEFRQDPAKQRLQALAAVLELQRDALAALHVDHCRGTGQQVAQPCMSRRGLALLLLDVTDIEQKAAHATLLALAEHARLQAVPGIAIASSQTQALNERLATVSQSAQAHAQLVAVARMYPLQR